MIDNVWGVIGLFDCGDGSSVVGWALIQLWRSQFIICQMNIFWIELNILPFSINFQPDGNQTVERVLYETNQRVDVNTLLCSSIDSLVDCWHWNIISNIFILIVFVTWRFWVVVVLLFVLSFPPFVVYFCNLGFFLHFYSQ